MRLPRWPAGDRGAHQQRFSREAFRHHSHIAGGKGDAAGFGIAGYGLRSPACGAHAGNTAARASAKRKS
jgi:hypothetical protein